MSLTHASASDEPDFLVEVRIKNARVLRAMKRAGIKTLSELSRRSMVKPTVLGMLINFRRKPLAGDDWSDAAFAISAALRCEPEDLWPEHMKSLQARKFCVSFETNEPTISEASISNSRDPDFAIDAKRAVPRMLAGLREREIKVLVRRAISPDTETLKVLSNELGVGVERVRQTGLAALRKTRHPSRWKHRLSLSDYEL